MLVVGPSDVQQASELLADLGIRIVSGEWFLGGFAGDDVLTAEFVSSKQGQIYGGQRGAAFKNFLLVCYYNKQHENSFHDVINVKNYIYIYIATSYQDKW